MSEWSKGYEDGIQKVLDVMDEMASPDDWGVPSVYPSVVRDVLVEDLHYTTDVRFIYNPRTKACVYCGEAFIPTITNPNKCSDCTRRAYK